MKRRRMPAFPTETPAAYPTAAMRELFAAILKLRTVDEATKFFRDLLTIAELEEFANRWQMVKLLLEGNSYATIAQKLKVSTATVTRVAHWLKNGLGGYRAIADRVFPTKFKDSDVPASRHRVGKYAGLKKIGTL